MTKIIKFRPKSELEQEDVQAQADAVFEAALKSILHSLDSNNIDINDETFQDEMGIVYCALKNLVYQQFNLTPEFSVKFKK